MFDQTSAIELLPGESGHEFPVDTDSEELAYRLTLAELDSAPVHIGRHVLPDGIETFPPGPFLAAVLSNVDRSRLNGHDLVRVLQAEARLVSHYEAGVLATTAEVAYSSPGAPDSPVERDSEELEFGAVEVATALNLTRRASEHQTNLALDLLQNLPEVWEALRSGTIDLRRARVISHGVEHLDAEDQRQAAVRALEKAGHQTTGQLRAALQRMCLAIDPMSAKTRYEDSVDDRRVIAEMRSEGTFDIHGLELPADRVSGVMHRINRLAKEVKRHGDHRRIDQIRADVFLDLLIGRHQWDESRTPKAVVDLSVSLETLAGLSDESGELAGYGPVIADIARQVIADQQDCQWRFTVRDEDGRVIHVGTTSRRPGQAMRRRVEASHPTCAFPGCRMPSMDCDLDHRIAVIDGGRTTECNLTPVCRYHHRAKHEGKWRYQPTRDGYSWTSPLGHLYQTSGRSP